MIFLKLLLFCASASLNHDDNLLLQENCNKIDVEVNARDHVNGNDGSVTIELTKGDRATVKYIFCDAKDGKVLNEGSFQKNELFGLERGKYLCIVSTKDCTKKIEFTIR